MEKIKVWVLAHRRLFVVFEFYVLFLFAILALLLAVTSLPIETFSSVGLAGAVGFGWAECAICFVLSDLIFDKRKDSDA